MCEPLNSAMLALKEGQMNRVATRMCVCGCRCAAGVLEL